MATPIPALSPEWGRHVIAATIPPLCATFGFHRAVFVGASLGGITSITVAASHPELVAAIVLIDVGHRLEEDGVRKIMDFVGRTSRSRRSTRPRPRSPSTSRIGAR